MLAPIKSESDTRSPGAMVLAAGGEVGATPSAAPPVLCAPFIAAVLTMSGCFEGLQRTGETLVDVSARLTAKLDTIQRDIDTQRERQLDTTQAVVDSTREVISAVGEFGGSVGRTVDELRQAGATTADILMTILQIAGGLATGGAVASGVQAGRLGRQKIASFNKGVEVGKNGGKR